MGKASDFLLILLNNGQNFAPNGQISFNL